MSKVISEVCILSKRRKSTELDIENDNLSDGLVVERRTGKAAKNKGGRQSEKKSAAPSFSQSFGYTRRMRNISSSFGFTGILVKGRNGVKALGALSKICRVKNVAISDDGVSFEVPSKHRGEIIALLDKLCYDYKIIRVSGAIPFAINLLARLGFAAGAICVIIGLGIYPRFVTSINVSMADGAYGQTVDNALNAKILGILSEYGAKEGNWLQALDCGGVEKRLLALEGISYASVQRKGTHIEVAVRRELSNDYLVEISGSAVVSKKTAVVTRVIVEGGTAAVSYGDVVRPGDSLIDGYVLYGDEKLDVEARGLVYGKVYHKKTVFFSDVLSVTEVTAVKRITKLSMFGIVPKTPNSPFEHYELETSVSNLGFMLPFSIYTYEFREVKITERPNELTEEEMKASVYSDIVSEFREPLKVLDVYYDTAHADGGVYVTVTVEAEEIIS